MGEKMLLVEEAQAIMLAHARRTEAVSVPVWQAAGRVLAGDVTTDIDLSPFANSAMDGYAVRAEDLASACADSPVELEVVGHEAAGHVFAGAVEPGTTVRIMTGAPVPPGADAVVKYEVVAVCEGDGNEGSRVAFTAPASVGENIREAGLEAHRGEAVLHAGEVCTAAGCGLAASAGHETLSVYRAPRVGIISLGTELVAPAVTPDRGQIRDANSSTLMAQALDAGAEPTFFGIAPDDEEAIATLMRTAAQTCDLVITSGGASAGDYDYVTALVHREGQVLFDRVSMRPGKAITFGLLGKTPYLGLSGNPAAAYVGFEMLARPMLRAMQGYPKGLRPRQQARVTHKVSKRQERRFYDRASVARDAVTGELTVTSATSQNSALLGTLHHANCLLTVPDGLAGYAAGDMVEVVRIDLPEGAVL